MEPKVKTFKREVAAGLLIALGVLVFNDNVPMVEILVWPVFTFASLSFGLDWWGKGGSMHRPYSPSPSMFPSEYPQGRPRGRYGEQRDQRSSQRPYRERGESDPGSEDFEGQYGYSETEK